MREGPNEMGLVLIRRARVKVAPRGGSQPSDTRKRGMQTLMREGTPITTVEESEGNY